MNRASLTVKLGRGKVAEENPVAAVIDGFQSDPFSHQSLAQKHLLMFPGELASQGHAAARDVIEAFGVPHTEVDLVLVNGGPVTFPCLPRNGDRISVYTVFRRLELGAYPHLQPEVQGEIGFVLDGHLGRLAAYLRMLRFDTFYRDSVADDELAQISATQHRILLSRDHLCAECLAHSHPA